MRSFCAGFSLSTTTAAPFWRHYPPAGPGPGAYAHSSTRSPSRCAQRAGDPGWDNYFRFIAQLANSGHPIGRFIAEDFNAIATDFITHLRAMFPAADEAAIHDAYLHLVAAAMHTYSNNLRLDSLTEGRMHTADIDERHRALLRFAEGGITALVTAP